MAETRLQQIFNELHTRGLVLNKKDFAAQVGAAYPNVVSAMKSEYSVASTPNLLAKAEALRRRLLPEEAPGPPVHKEVTVSPDLLNIIATQAETIRSQQEVIARLSGVETKKGAV